MHANVHVRENTLKHVMLYSRPGPSENQFHFKSFISIVIILILGYLPWIKTLMQYKVYVKILIYDGVFISSATL